jgi:hypothetical protein
MKRAFILSATLFFPSGEIIHAEKKLHTYYQALDLNTMELIDLTGKHHVKKSIIR